MKTMIVCLAVLFAIINLNAQKKFEKMCTQSERVILNSGDSFLCNCDSAYVLNTMAAKILFATLEQKSVIIDSLENQKMILKNVIRLQETELKRWQKIASIQDSSYRQMSKVQVETAILVNQAVDNTKQALSYARKMQLSSYLTSFAVGGVAGGLIDSKKYTFGTGGALTGALGGLLINYLFQELIFGD